MQLPAFSYFWALPIAVAAGQHAREFAGETLVDPLWVPACSSAINRSLAPLAGFAAVDCCLRGQIGHGWAAAPRLPVADASVDAMVDPARARIPAHAGRRPHSVRHGEHAARTSFTYDPVTERLLRLQSQGGGRSLQDLHYSYDPVGNLTQVRDAAQAIVYRDNAALEAVNDYRYDALYRLVEATGREHEGQAANGRTPKAGDAVVVPLRTSSPSDPKAMRRYVQRYRYDAVGNLRTLQHQAGAGSFRREYAYAEHGNRLRATGNAALALHERYAYDVAGHMVAMPHLSRLHWDETDALELIQRGTQQIWLQYAGGVRVRKVVRSGEGVVEDRKYLGAEELYTKRRGGALVERTLTEHVGGALQVDIKLVADGETIAKPVALRRYALADHLGSVKLEVDPDGQVIAYEEFHPYGTTSYRAMHSGLDAAANRYRYTGMEKDEETGLAQHGARYYAAWLGRWTAPDPTGLADGVNRYAYCRGSPTGRVDLDGNKSYEKMSWGAYDVGVRSPLGVQQTKTLEAEEFARDEAQALTSLEESGAPEAEIELQRSSAQELRAAARRERALLELAINGSEAEAYLQASGETGVEALALIARAVNLSSQQDAWESRRRSHARETQVYLTADGMRTQRQMDLDRLYRGINAGTRGGVIAAGVLWWTNDVALAEFVANIAGMAAAASDPAVQVVQRSRAKADAPRQVDHITDMRDPGVARGTVQLADAAQRAHPRPATVAVLETRQGSFTGAAGSSLPLHPLVQEALDAVTAALRSKYHGKCAEAQAISRSLEAGVDPAGGRMTAARVRRRGHPAHGTTIAPCRTCAILKRAFGIE